MTRFLPLSAALAALSCATAGATGAEALELGPAAIRELSVPGKVTLVVCFASWSDGAKVALPPLAQLAESHSAALAVKALAVDEDQRLVPPFLEQLGIRWDYSPDPGGAHCRGLGLQSVPGVLVVDATGARQGSLEGHGADVAQRSEKLARELIGEPHR